MNDWSPMDQEQSQLQIKSIIDLLGDDACDVIDVGCGDGRVLVPLVTTGHRLVGIDSDPTAIDACAKACADVGADATLIVGNLFDVLPLQEPVDAILCCGQTFMLLSDVDQAVQALQLFRESLRFGGMIIIDDIPGDLWAEVADGRWINGVNDDNTLQMVWANDDAVFALREGEQIDNTSCELREGDLTLRLWTMGSLRLAAKLAGLSAPEVPVTGAVLIMRVA